ncbi:hypothetical protein ACIBH1_24630 [Nonomuraea sp. NPDC050663]|uniref:hypothetical protein n=1 Tax=Nonomuraea sp. NPDC050663 TaxID=3364370 RepID=UPI0037B232C5
MRPPRPLVLILAVTALALVWPGAVVTMVSQPAENPPFAIFVACFWTLVWYFWLFRIWRGGVLAIGLMVKAAIAIPAVLLLGQVALVVWSGFGAGTAQWAATGCAVLALLSGLALARREVRRYAEAVAEAPPAPPGLLGASPSGQETSLFGCAMLVVAVVALIVVGVISNVAAAEATGEYALMVAVGVVVVIGIGGYLWLRFRAARAAHARTAAIRAAAARPVTPRSSPSDVGRDDG